MSHSIRNKSFRPTKRPAGSTVSNLLIFLGASVLIVGVVIAFEKSERETKTPPVAGPGEFRPSGETGTVGEGSSTDNEVKPGIGPTTSTDNHVAHPVVPVGVEPVHPDPAMRYVGDGTYKYYHRLNCKMVQMIPQNKLVYFDSAEGAWAKGYVPCKICRPPAPTGDTTSHGPKPVPKIAPPDIPVSLPVKDVAVSFPFQVVERLVPPEKGFVRVELTAEVENPLRREDILKLSQKLVAAEIAKQKVNSISVFIRKKVGGGAASKWFCAVDWAPFGNLTRETEVATGDYRNHQFSIVLLGAFSKP